MSVPDELSDGVKQCMDDDGNFQFEKWGTAGLDKVNPLWLLKYLPNMPASHIAIYNDLRGPNNSITLREASPGCAIMEAHSTISRGHADVLLVGATGTRIHHVRSLHASMQETLASDCEDSSNMCRPFDATRDGSVLGEGAGTIVCETLEHAQARGAKILGEVVGFASTCVGPRQGDDHLQTACVNVLKAALGDADPKSIGHINAHGTGAERSDQQEAAAIAKVFGDASVQPPVTTLKGNIGHLGAGSGMIEIVASILALGEQLFPIRNYTQADPLCPINASTGKESAGDSFISLNFTPQGQASAVRIERLAG